MNECLHAGMNEWFIGDLVFPGLNQEAFLFGKTRPCSWAMPPQLPGGSLPPYSAPRSLLASTLGHLVVSVRSQAPQCHLPRASPITLLPQSDALHSVLLALPFSCFRETLRSVHLTRSDCLEISQSCSTVEAASFVYF